MLGTTARLLGGLPLQARVLIAGTFINKAGSFIVPFLTLVLKREFGLSDAATGGLVAAYGAGSIVSLMVGGVLTDRVGRRATLLASLFGSGVLAIAMGAAPSLAVFLPLLVAFGFVADLYRPAAAAMISDLLPSSERAVGYAALRLAVNLGFAVGMVLGGVIADWNWRALFVGDGVTTLAYGLVVLMLIRETRPATPERAVAAEAGRVSPWRDGPFLLMLAASLLFCCLVFVCFTVLPLTVTLSAGYSSVVYGLLVAVNGVLIAVFEVPVVHWLRTRRRLRVAALGAVIASVGFGGTGLVMHWSWFLLTVLLWTAGEILVVPQQNAFVADWAPPAARGRYIGLYHATWGLGLTLAPPLFLPLHTALGEARFWGLTTLLALPLAITLLYLDRVADRPERLRGRSDAPVEPDAPLPAIASEAER